MKYSQEQAIKAAKVAMQEVILEAQRYSVYQIIDPRIDINYVPFYKAMLTTLTAKVWGQKLSHHSVSYPATWWQAFKLEVVRKIWKNCPVKMTTQEFTVRSLYPELPPDPLNGKYKRTIVLDATPQFNEAL